MRALIDWDYDRQVARARTDYSPRFIEAVKSAIPSENRDWDPRERAWKFDVKTLAVALNILVSLHCMIQADGF